MRRVLITGITGYIGSNLARGLLPDCEVYGLAREPVNETYIADIREQVRLLVCDGSYASVETALREAAPELVYHLAAYYTGARGASDTPKLLAANVALGGYLLEAMCSAGCGALVFASSVMAHYGGAAYRPLNLYAATKRAMSDLIAYYTDAGLLRAVTLVLSDTYGPGDQRPKILNLILHAAQNGEPIDLSDVKQEYDVVYIDDVVRAFRMAGERALAAPERADETYQVCAAEPLTLRDTVETLQRVSGITLNARWGARPPQEREQRKSVRLYPALPGWRQQTALCEGLATFCGML